MTDSNPAIHAIEGAAIALRYADVDGSRANLIASLEAAAAEVARLTTKRGELIAIWKGKRIRELEADVARLTDENTKLAGYMNNAFTLAAEALRTIRDSDGIANHNGEWTNGRWGTIARKALAAIEAEQLRHAIRRLNRPQVTARSQS